MLSLLLAACESRYGAYLVVKGDVHFDQVELYFGKPIDSSGPSSKFATPSFGPQQGLVFKRTFDASDLQSVTATTQTTYYVPAADNQYLGAYVVAVALLDGKPVGIAEYFDFAVPTDSVHEYVLEVEPWNPQVMERWGDAPGCIAWKKPRDNRGAIVAVVHDDDRDCDAVIAANDCDDLCSEGSDVCAPETEFCETGTVVSCAVGCSKQGTCTPTMCLPPTTCSSFCQNAATYQEQLECGTLMEPTPHFEVLVDRDQALDLCAVQFKLSPGAKCVMPRIEAIDPKAAPDFTYMVKTDSDDPTICKLDIAVTSGVKFEPTVNHHMLISIAPEATGPRYTFTVGVQVVATPTFCVAEPYTVVTPPKPLFDCRP